MLLLDFEQDHFRVEEVLLLHVKLLDRDIEVGPVGLRASVSPDSPGWLLRAGRAITPSVNLGLLFKPECLVGFNLSLFCLIVVVAVAHDQRPLGCGGA